MSEFGFQALPPFDTIKTYASEPDWNMTSYLMEYHQRSGNGNGLMLSQMTDTFACPRISSRWSFSPWCCRLKASVMG